MIGDSTERDSRHADLRLCERLERDAALKEFIEACRARGWHFTANWVAKRLKQLQDAV